MSCTPDNYWQINALEHGRAYFMIMDQLKSWPDMSIMGLPLMSDYYCVFDREYDANGVIKSCQGETVITSATFSKMEKTSV